MGIACFFGLHDWNGCTCAKCATVKDEDHDWQKDCEKCFKCGATRENIAKLAGCACVACERANYLFRVCEQGDCTALTQLITAGEKLNIRDRDGRTLLCLAAGKGHKEALELLIAAGADINEHVRNSKTALQSAAGNGHIHAVEVLLQKGADINARGFAGKTALHDPAHSGRLDMMELLIKNGADVNAKNDNGETPLHYAAENFEVPAARLLLENGADIRARDNNGHTVIDAAKQRLAIMHAALLGFTSSASLSEMADKTGYSEFVDFISGAIMVQLQSHETGTAVAGANVTTDEFASCSMAGSVKCRTSILRIPELVQDLVRELYKQEIPRGELIELLDNNLLSVCSECNRFIGGKSLLMSHALTMFESAIFTGNSCGMERLASGKCINSSCDSTMHDLYWNPALDPVFSSELRSRGIVVDPKAQQKKAYPKPG